MKDAEASALRAELRAVHDAAWPWALACARGDVELAQDALQDAYVAVLEGRARFLGRSAFRTWLFGVIRMTTLATRRKRAIRALLFEDVTPRLEAAVPSQAADIWSTSRALAAALRAMPDRQREAVLLVLRHDFTLDEAAAAMGVTPGACRQHYARAKEKLRRALTPQEAGDG